MSLLIPCYKNPLKRNGTAQVERLVAALSPDNFKLDNRSLKDIMVASYRYASMLHFPDESGKINGDWACFWEAETLTYLAVLSTIDADEITTRFAEIENTNIDENAKEDQNYLNAIKFIRSIAITIENHYQKLPDGIPIKKEIAAIIRKNRMTDAEQLEGALNKLISWHKDVTNPDVLDACEYEIFISSPNWGIPNPIAFGDIGFDKTYSTDNWQSLRQLVYAFQQTIIRIKKRASYWFDKNLETPQLRQPHIALFLTFLRLFQHTRDEMNGLTKRHLDFYYEKVLHLHRNPAKADEVYLIFQLANTVDQHLIQKGTELLAGKKDGKTLIFETIENQVLSGATVEEIKNTYLTSRGITASPDVNVAYKDGLVEENVPIDCFRAFGDDDNLPEGEIGFAISSPQLILREGKRIVDIIVDGANFNTKKEDLKIKLSSEEGLFDLNINDNIDTATTLDKIDENTLDSYKQGFNVKAPNTIRIVLEPDAPAIDIPAKPLENGIKTDLPYVIITNPGFSANRGNKIKNININVKVFGIKESLIVESDEGIFDGTKKFLPFGSHPKIDNQFYLGSQEVFQKKIDDLDINFDWVDPVDFGVHYEPYVEAGFKVPHPEISVDLLNNASFIPVEENLSFINKDNSVIRWEKNYYLSGYVVNKEKPRPNVMVAIKDLGLGTKTDKNGYYELPLNLEQIRSGLTAQYFSGEKKLETPVGNFAEINVDFSGEEFNRGKNFPFTISGVAKSPDCKPLEKINVEIKDLGLQTTTNADGYYSILLEDRAKICGEKLEILFSSENTLKLDIPVEFSSIIDVTLGKENNSFERKKGFSYHIRGTVLDQEGSSIPDTTITLELQTLRYSKKTDAGGKFSMPVKLSEVCSEANLIISNEGYETLKIGIGEQTEISATLASIGSPKKAYSFSALKALRSPNTIPFEKLSNNLPSGFLKFQLKGTDYLHDEYQKVLIAHSAALVKKASKGAEGNPNVGEGSFPLPPYTPTTNGIIVNYCSIQEMEFLSEHDSFYHILPFGYKKVNQGNGFPLVYGYSKTDEDTDLANANLYLGIQNLKPGSNLSLLFQFKEGTEGSFDLLPPEKTDFQWSYLAKNNQWLRFEVDAVRKNTTQGYTRTGIVQLQTPYDMSKENTLFDGDYHWIRLSAVEINGKKVKALPCLVSISAQAIEARFKIDSEGLAHFIEPKPLEKGTIKRLAKSDSKVKKIEQPLPSFSGSLPEKDNDFYQRISERLNHRNRAVTVIDYERILLEKYPSVYRAKCLNHTRPDCEIAAGYITLAVIPDVKNRVLKSDFKPRFAKGDLREMAVFLRPKTNFFVASYEDEEKKQGAYLATINPHYEEVKVEATITFKAGEDVVFYTKKMKEELKLFIAPWAKDEPADISFNRKLSKADFIQFIEQQEYVDAIKELKLHHNDTEVSSNIIIPSTSFSILTTATEHLIFVREN